MTDQVRETLDAINRAWRQHDFSGLEAHLDENIVMKGPGLKEYANGRRAFIESYAQFMDKSHVTEYTETNHTINTWGNVAVATYDWTMTYEQKRPDQNRQGK